MPFKETVRPDSDPVYLIDGSAFIYRGYYAFRDMSTSTGFPTNALYVTLRMLLKILREEKPAYAGFFLDPRERGFRADLYPEYKAKRAATPEDMIKQIEPIKEAAGLLGFTVHVAEGGEADDCIASLAQRLKGDRAVAIVGADKDLKQCLDRSVWMWDPGAKQEKITSLDDFREDTGLEPASWPDFQALIGDSSDNIPGVPGIGDKSARQIMEGRTTLEEVWAGLDDIPPKFVKKLDGHQEASYLYRDLTRLRTDFCQDLDLEALRVAEPDLDGLRGFLKRFEFRSLLAELPGPASAEKPKAAASQGSLFPQAAPDKPEPVKSVRVASLSEIPEAKNREIGLVPLETGFAVGLDGREYLFKGDPSALAGHLSTAARLAAPETKPLLRANPAWNDVPQAAWFDLALAAYLLNPEERDYSQERLLRSFLNDPDMPAVPQGAHGLEADALATCLARKLENAGMTALFRDLEMPLRPVLADMERAGVAVDLDALAAFLDEVNDKLGSLSARITELAGEEFNIRSSQQLAVILFDRLGLKPRGKTPGGAPSTSQAVLEKMENDHEIVSLILEFRGLEKMRGTYLEPLPKLVDEMGRIHTTFNQTATATGRLSSSGPNLQNIPIRGPMGMRMRACFTSGPGRELVAADYSQIELRLLAHLSDDPGLKDAFLRDEDIHARTAALLFDKSPGDVEPDERRSAKTINFGLLYGMGPQRLSRELKITMPRAKEFIARYFEAMPKVKAFYEQIEEEAKSEGYVTTLLGRRRILPDIHSRNQQQYSQAVRQAINTRVQGSAADAIKLAMIRTHRDDDLRTLSARLILQVHDELLLETPEDNAEQAADRLKRVMENITHDLGLTVPLAVEAGTGHTWAEAH
ncbi:DNA polymerase I [Desulfohalovibrio reitneri]|uniref:DNA polymerase I n=1 Tax=Desulfohalovibrio reitneri TaxID=1307759 RepID=UPI0004A73A97|nr:DNA polymerase I [Desulfohalovibrio reitneri]